MKPRITILTLGVDNLECSVEFYHKGLGLPTDGIIGTEFENGAVAFFDLQPGFKLALWLKKSMAAETKLPLTAASALEFTMAHNVASKEEVHEVMSEAQKAGGTIITSPADTFYGGYAGYFQDPDGHLWEVAYNPHLVL